MERPFAKGTLQLYRAQLLVHPQMRLAFERSLELAKKTGYVRNSKPGSAGAGHSSILGPRGGEGHLQPDLGRHLAGAQGAG